MTALRSAPAVSRPPHSRGRRRAGLAGFAVALAVLFVVYLRLSRTYAENSDEANILLMAADLAHGNVLLSGWDVSDVPFITTELPEIAVLIRLFGLHLDTAHIAAALTYTIVTAAAVLLARRGRRPLVRGAVVIALMAAPQTGIGVFVLLFSVGHIGTAAPVLLAWLILDHGPGDRRRRWLIPAAVGLLLAWALLADPLVLVIAIAPALFVATVRTAPALTRRSPNEGGFHPVRTLPATRWREITLALAAAAACLAAWCGQRLLRAAGGYRQQPVPWHLDPVSTWPGHTRTVLHGLLAMFGADFAGGSAVSGFGQVLAVSRLACVAVAVAGAAVAAWRFFRPRADLVDQLLLSGLVANLAAYLPSSLADHTALNSREFAPVLPFAAVLAARLLADRLGDELASRLRNGRTPGGRVLAAGLAVLPVWYAAGLAREAAAPAAASPFRALEAYLEAHHLRAGLGGYWDASVITVDTGGAVTIRAVTSGCLQPYDWESKPSWYVPGAGPGPVTFVLGSAATGYFSRWLPSAAALRRLAAADPERGAPRGLGGGFQLHEYAGDVLTALPRLARCRPPN